MVRVGIFTRAAITTFNEAITTNAVTIGAIVSVLRAVTVRAVISTRKRGIVISGVIPKPTVLDTNSLSATITFSLTRFFKRRAETIKLLFGVIAN